MILRDYQAKAFADIRQAYRDRYRSPLYQGPTGMGKTVLFSFIARNAAKKGNRVCILVHRRELLFQTCKALVHDHGRIAPGFTPMRNRHIQVATVQTLVRRLDKWSGHYGFDLIIVDEAHHAQAATYRKILDANPQARVLGVTATPCRLDDKGLGELFDTLILGPSVQELTDQGYLAPAKVYAPSIINTEGLHSRMGDWVTKELVAAADTPTITGDAITHYRRLANRLPAIAFAVNVQHAEHVAEQFRQAGYRAIRVDGGTPQQERDAAIVGLGRGELDVLTSCEIISEGVDVPVVACGILLRPTKSLGLAMQQMGRILRPAPGKDVAIILDHAGNCLRHGLPATPRTWSLEQGVVPKKPGDGPDVLDRRCPECFHLFAPSRRTCPECGFEYPVQERELEEREGELVELTEEQIAKEKARKDARQEQGRATTLEELQALGKARGYKPGWAWAVYNARGGHGGAARRAKRKVPA